MQAVSVLPFSEISGIFENDFAAKLRIYEDSVKSEEERVSNDEVEEENEEEEHENEEVEEEQEEEEEEEFSFAFANPISPVSADEVFDNGQIRPVYPLFNQDLLFSDEYDGGADILPPVKKVFVQRRDNSPASSSASSTTAAADPKGEYCEWRPNMAVKSNSTGFSKIWKLRDHKLRSNSDGKDAFVFLNPATVLRAERSAEKARSDEGRNGTVKKVNNVAKKGKTTSSSLTATEKHYVNNRARKESDKRKSYLPYRQELFGFFAPSNGLSRNVHPY